MKKFLKELVPASIIAFVISFMFFIYEPIITYSANIDDFWFNFNLMLPNILLYFVCFFCGLMVFYIFFYFIFCHLLKRKNIYKIILIISFIGFAFTYIQGNYLIGNLPTLTGETIDWSTFTKDTIIAIVVLVVLIIAEIILIKKMKIDKTIKINSFISIAIFLMILASFVSTLLNPDLFKEKIVATATNDNINKASSDKNFFIFIADSVDSADFANVVKESDENINLFDGFTYYPDTLTAYFYTRDSIPFILTGIWNECEQEFTDYYNDAFEQSELFNELQSKDYDMNFYEYQLYCNRKNAEKFSNIEIYNSNIHSVKYAKQLTKYILYKYLPYPLKKYSRIETASFDACRIDKDENYFNWSDRAVFDIINDNELEIVENKYFQCLHIEGGHVPFDYDENVNKIDVEDGTYEKKLQATLKIISVFINRLKENNVYDNSVIIIMADHGEAEHGRQNPILYIKGLNERHEMNTSSVPLSYEDLQNAYLELLNEKKTEALFQNIDVNRTRRFINNLYTEERLIEYELVGNAGDKSNYKKTGREFNRESKGEKK